MNIEFDPDKWLHTFGTHPVLLIILGGMLCGTGFAQIAKQFYLAFWCVKVSVARYRFGMNMLAALATAFATYRFWNTMIPEDSGGLGGILSITSGVCGPLAYKSVKALVGWKYPEFADRWGDSRIVRDGADLKTESGTYRKIKANEPPQPNP